MAKNLEQEYKTLLTETEFHRLLKELDLNTQDVLVQKNYYYDSPQGLLLSLDAALRLRLFVDDSEWTLKQVISENTSLELTQTNPRIITPPQRLDKRLFHEADLLGFLQDHQIPLHELTLNNQMTTWRYHYQIPGALFCLDHTFFPQTEDFELECELENLDQANLWFDFLETYQIEYKPAAKKLSRAAQYHAQSKTQS